MYRFPLAPIKLLPALLLAALLPTLAACASLPGGLSGGPAGNLTDPPSERAAKELLARGDYVAASQEYRRLAGTQKGNARKSTLLRSSDALIRAAQVADARSQLAGITPTARETELTARKRVQEARIALIEDRAEEALRLLAEAERLHPSDPALQADLTHARAQAEITLLRPLAAVTSLARRDAFLTERDAIARNQRELWDLLERATSDEIKRELAQARDPVHLGWLRLSLLSHELGDHAARYAHAVRAWREQHPQHPIQPEFLAALAAPVPDVVGPVKQIALLLPLSSPHRAVAQAARAVHDGFLAMAAIDDSRPKPVIKLYDFGAAPAADAWRKAVAEGAEFVVGPLGLESVDQVAKDTDLSVPTMLLSHSTQSIDNRKKHVFQFGLPPEQEATQVAERAWLDGRRTALVLIPDSVFGKRMAAAFTEQWRQLGGVVLTEIAYPLKRAEYSGPIKQGLLLDASEKRHALLGQRLKTRLNAEPRPRADVDMIFLAADAPSARLIKPQLNFHRAGHVPVYASSHIYGGRPDPAADADLDAIRFCDMPWLLSDEGAMAALRDQLPGDSPYAGSALDRLYALGLDAYGVIPDLNRLSTESAVRYMGATASLSLTQDGKLHRALTWARFEGGVPKTLDTP